MKKWRTPILLVLAILDIAVIAILGYTIVSRRKTTASAAATLPPCSQIILSDLDAYTSPAVAWDTERLTLALTVFYTSPDPPAASAQLLWDALDSVRRATALGCPLPPEIALIVHAHGQTNTIGHVARLHGADIAAWAAGALPEAELVQRGAYWRNAETDQAATPTD